MAGRRGNLAEWRERARQYAAGAVAALFPHCCAGCGAEGSLLCPPRTAKTMTPLRVVFYCSGCGVSGVGLGRCVRPACQRSPLDGLAAVGSYGDPVLRTLLQLYKYEGVEEAGERLAELFRTALAGCQPALAPLAGAGVVPVPLHPFRLAYRGFNQAERLAVAWAGVSGGAVAAGVLGRRFRFQRQATIVVAAERRQAASGSVYPRRRVSGPVVVVDDVATTGATLAECARALKRAGADRVYGLALLKG